MRRVYFPSLVLAGVLVLLAACKTTALVPGADKVRMTNTPSDVANCRAVGNLSFDIHASPGDMPLVRNQTIGFGGNTAFLTAGSGVAYQCP